MNRYVKEEDCEKGCVQKDVNLAKSGNVIIFIFCYSIILSSNTVYKCHIN